MSTFEQSIDVAAMPAEAFRYLADFTNVPRWDPGMAESRLVEGSTGQPGAVYDVVAVFRGTQVPFRYRLAAAEDGRRLLFEGEGAKARSTDEIILEPAAGGTHITYRADLRMKGPYRLGEPFLRGTFDRMGREAMAGLKGRLDTTQP